MARDEPFPAWLRRHLKARGWARRGLAERAGVGHSAVASWVAGRHAPGRDNRAELARALGVPQDAVPGEPPRHRRSMKEG